MITNSWSRMKVKPRRRHNKLFNFFFFFEVLQILFDLLRKIWHDNNVDMDRN